eukprot:1255900-Rhodomonas_salina.1
MHRVTTTAILVCILANAHAQACSTASDCSENAVCTGGQECVCSDGFIGNAVGTGTQVYDLPYSGHSHSAYLSDNPSTWGLSRLDE